MIERRLTPASVTLVLRRHLGAAAGRAGLDAHVGDGVALIVDDATGDRQPVDLDREAHPLDLRVAIGDRDQRELVPGCGFEQLR